MLLAFTVATLAHAIVRRRMLERHGRGDPNYTDLRLFANDQIVSEVLRLAKHCILVWLVWLTPVDATPLIDTRNTGILIVAVLLGASSAWALVRRHQRFKQFERRATNQ